MLGKGLVSFLGKLSIIRHRRFFVEKDQITPKNYTSSSKDRLTRINIYIHSSSLLYIILKNVSISVLLDYIRVTSW